jgi:hypothetical protein
MAARMGVVQSTSSVAFFGIEIIGDWCAANAILNNIPRRDGEYGVRQVQDGQSRAVLDGAIISLYLIAFLPKANRP